MLIGRSENKGLALFTPFEDEARPGVVNILQNNSFTEVTIFVVIRQNGRIWLPYPRMMDAIASNIKKRMMNTTTPGLTSFSNGENCNIFLFSERPIALNFCI